MNSDGNYYNRRFYFTILILILVFPVSGFLNLTPSPVNWVLGVVVEIFVIVYLIVGLRKTKNQNQ